MRSGQKFTIAILMWVLSIGAVAAADDADKGPAPGTTAKASPDAPKEPAPPPSVTVIGPADARGILGREVRSAAGENMGRIVDVIVDRSGAVRAAVIQLLMSRSSASWSTAPGKTSPP